MDEVEIYTDAAGGFRWRRRSENGQVVSIAGESYTRENDAARAARQVNGEQVTYTFEGEGAE